MTYICQFFTTLSTLFGNIHNMYLKETFAVLSCIIGVTLVSSECEHGWVQYKEDCIFFNGQRTNWLGAETECKKRGAWLASDDTQDKHDFLFSIINVLKNIRVYPHYIGGSDYAFEGRYRWIETGQYAGPYSNWGAGFPNGNWSKNCMLLNWEGDQLMWEDENCGASHYFICEKSSNATPPVVIGRR